MAKSRPRGKSPAKSSAKPANKPKPAKAKAKPARTAKKSAAKQPAARKPAAKAATKAKPAKPAAKAQAKAKAKPQKSHKPAKSAKSNKPARQREPAAKPAKQGKPTNQLSLPGLGSASAVAVAIDAGDEDSEGDIRQHLGTITVPSGQVALFDINLIGYLPRPALDPLIVTTAVPADRPLRVVGVRVGAGRFAECWQHVAVELAPGRPATSRKLGEAAVDFARLLWLDHATIDHWQHEDSLDGRADLVFWGRDALALAKTMAAHRLPGPDGHHGWTDLAVADAETKADRADQLKREHGWQLTVELRPHSHHHHALAAARASGLGAGTIDVAAARGLLFFTTWGNGVYPVYLDLDAAGTALAIRVQLAH